MNNREQKTHQEINEWNTMQVMRSAFDDCINKCRQAAIVNGQKNLLAHAERLRGKCHEFAYQSIISLLYRAELEKSLEEAELLQEAGYENDRRLELVP